VWQWQTDGIQVISEFIEECIHKRKVARTAEYWTEGPAVGTARPSETSLDAIAFEEILQEYLHRILRPPPSDKRTPSRSAIASRFGWLLSGTHDGKFLWSSCDRAEYGGRLRVAVFRVNNQKIRRGVGFSADVLQALPATVWIARFAPHVLETPPKRGGKGQSNMRMTLRSGRENSRKPRLVLASGAGPAFSLRGCGSGSTANSNGSSGSDAARAAKTEQTALFRGEGYTPPSATSPPPGAAQGMSGSCLVTRRIAELQARQQTPPQKPAKLDGVAGKPCSMPSLTPAASSADGYRQGDSPPRRTGYWCTRWTAALAKSALAAAGTSGNQGRCRRIA